MSDFDLYDKRYGSRSLLDLLQAFAVILAVLAFMFVWMTIEDSYYVFAGTEMVNQGHLDWHRNIPKVCFLLALLDVVFLLLPKYVVINGKPFSKTISAVMTLIIGILLVVLPVIFMMYLPDIKWGVVAHMGIGGYFMMIAGILMAVGGLLSFLPQKDRKNVNTGSEAR